VAVGRDRTSLPRSNRGVEFAYFGLLICGAMQAEVLLQVQAPPGTSRTLPLRHIGYEGNAYS
jgi:hypothetical protein